MDAWTAQLDVNPLPGLLRAGDQALIFFVRRDLLDEDPGPVEALQELPEAARSGRRLRAKIRLDSVAAWMVRENPPRDARFAATPDGGAVLTLRAERPDALVRWVLHFSLHAQVLSPPWLRKRCADVARRLAERYAEAAHA